MNDMVEGQILRWAALTPEVEVCGYVFDGDHVVPMRNIAAHPDKFFVMDLEQQTHAYLEFGTPIACWHSHPNGDLTPSSTDVQHHADAGLRMLIAADGQVYDYGIPGS